MRLSLTPALALLFAPPASAGPLCFEPFVCSDPVNYGAFSDNPAVVVPQPQPQYVVVSSTPVYAAAPVAVNDALAAVNAKRAARGLRPYVFDPNLTAAAQAAASYRASYRMFGHTRNDFQFLPGGTSAASAGCAAYPASYGFMACCVYDRYTYAGAASVLGPDGRTYHHIFVR